MQTRKNIENGSHQSDLFKDFKEIVKTRDMVSSKKNRRELLLRAK
jgi:hypothetical protein